MTRPHSAQGHAAAGRYYGQRGLRPFASERPPSNMDRLARYYSHPAAIERRPRFQLAAPSHPPAILPCRGDVSGTFQRRLQDTGPQIERRTGFCKWHLSEESA